MQENNYNYDRKEARVSARINEDTKNMAEDFLRGSGLSVSDYIRLSLNKLANGFNFDNKVEMFVEDSPINTYDNNLVVGVSGSGKTFKYVLPSILEAKQSFVIDDCYRGMHKKLKSFLESEGYKVKALDFKDLENSNHYNPLFYLNNEDDILNFVDLFLSNTNKDRSFNKDESIVSLEKYLLITLISYLVFFSQDFDRNLGTVLKLLENTIETKTGDDSIFDLMLKEVVEKFSDDKEAGFMSFHYKLFRDNDIEERKKTVLSLMSRFSFLSDKWLSKHLETDDLELDKLGEEKVALFIKKKDMYDSTNVLTTMAYDQAIRNNIKYDSDNDISIKVFLDEFQFVGDIPNLTSYLAYCKKFDLSVDIIIQSMPMINTLYPSIREYNDLIDKMDRKIMIGGSDRPTREWFRNQAYNLKVNNGAISNVEEENYSPSSMFIGRDDCIVISDEGVYKHKIYDTTKHPNYGKIDWM